MKGEENEKTAIQECYDKFEALAEEALALGVQVVWVLTEYDRLACEERTYMGKNCGPTATMGMLHAGIMQTTVRLEMAYLEGLEDDMEEEDEDEEGEPARG
jgi:hypothetical protein